MILWWVRDFSSILLWHLQVESNLCLLSDQKHTHRLCKVEGGHNFFIVSDTCTSNCIRSPEAMPLEILLVRQLKRAISGSMGHYQLGGHLVRGHRTIFPKLPLKLLVHLDKSKWQNTWNGTRLSEQQQVQLVLKPLSLLLLEKTTSSLRYVRLLFTCEQLLLC